MPPMIDGRSARAVTDDVFSTRLLNLDGPDGDAARRRAFALVSLARPGVDAAQWAEIVRHYRRRSPQRAGLVALSDRRGYAHAVFLYAVDAVPRRILRLHDLAIAHVPGGGLEAALSRCADGLAMALGCSAVRLELPRGALRPDGLEDLRALGYGEAGTTTLVRDLALSSSASRDPRTVPASPPACARRPRCRPGS